MESSRCNYLSMLYRENIVSKAMAVEVRKRIYKGAEPKAISHKLIL